MSGEAVFEVGADCEMVLRCGVIMESGDECS